MWVSMTWEVARAYATKAIKLHGNAQNMSDEESIELLTKSLYHDGEAPDLAIHKYKREL